VSPRVREDSMHPRLQSGACARPLNFTVRRARGITMSSRLTSPATASLASLGLWLAWDLGVATTTVCTGAHDGWKAQAKVVVPSDRREAFIRYIQENGPNETLGLVYGAAESDSSLTMDLENYDSGSIVITIENKKPQPDFVFRIQTCNTDRDWHPYWDHALRLAKAFPDANVSPGSSNNRWRGA